MRNRLLIKEEIKTALRRLIKEGITKKSDFQSVGSGGVNEPGDVEHILALFADPKIGLSKEVEEIKKECSEKTDYKEIGECQKFHDFIGKYQSEKVFSNGFSDSRIDPDRETITNLYNTILGIDSKPAELTPEAKIEISGEIVPPKSLDYLIELIIKEIEGGYYHPGMNQGDMGKSGETLFGIDRVAGGENNQTPIGIEFWNLVDSESGWAPKSERAPKWKRYHKPSNPKFLEIVKKMQSKNYELHKKWHGVTPEMEKLIESDARLQLHFLYGVWNGYGFYGKFYKDLVNFVKLNPNPNIKDVVENVLESRARHAGTERANKMRQVMNMIK
jgi:hypothetical protein